MNHMTMNFKKLTVVLLLANNPLSVYAEEKKLDLYDVVKSTLDNSPVLKIQGFQVDVAKAAERIQSGAFNVKTAAKVTYDKNKTNAYANKQTANPVPPISPLAIRGGPTTLGASDVDNQAFQASVEQKFRTGVSAKLQYDLTRRDPSGRTIVPADYQYGTTSRGKVALTLTVPFLKGGWEVSAAAQEKEANLQYQAAVANYKQLITKTLLGTVNAYWNYTAAYEILQQRIAIKGRVEKAANANPTNSFMAGFLNEKVGSITTATQEMEKARIALAESMGISIEDAQKMGTPDAANFPKNPEKLLATFNTKTATQEWMDLALENRNDYHAAKLKVDASDILLAKDEQDLYPELTAAVTLGYNGITHGNGFDNYVDSTYKNVRGLDHGASLTFSYPIGNDAAEGAYDRDKAFKMLNTVAMNESARGIKLAVQRDVAQLYGRLKIVVQAKQTMDAYRTSMRDLFNKTNLNNAEATSGIVVLQQKLEDSIVAYVNAEADFANAIAQARFETGVLISNAEGSPLTADINMEKVVSLPTAAK